MIAQGGAYVLGSKNSATAQNRNHLIHENLGAGREHIGHQIETVGSAREEPFFQSIGDLLGGTHDQPVTAAYPPG
jgi:hypothetical protein